MVTPRMMDLPIETAEALYTLLSTEQQNLINHVRIVMGKQDHALVPPLIERLCNSVQKRSVQPLVETMEGLDEKTTKTLFVSIRRAIFETLGATIFREKNLGPLALDHVIELFDSVLYEVAMRRFAQGTAEAADSMMLYDFSCSLVTSSSPDELVEVIMTYLEPFEATASAILRFEPEMAEVRIKIVSSVPAHNSFVRTLETSAAPNSPLESILFSQTAIIIDDPENDPLLDTRARDLLRDLDVGGLLSAPLLVHAELVGRLIVAWRSRQPLHSHMARMLHTLAAQATAVVERLFVMERYQRELEERIALQATLLQAQQTLVRELGTPIIPVADDVLLMPLIGTIDDARAGRITEVMLDGIVSRGAATAILDLSGVPAATAQIADALLGVTRAVRLVGAEVVLTGIRPDMAKTLVEGGAMLEGFVVRSTVQSGLAFAFAKTSTRKRRPLPRGA